MKRFYGSLNSKVFFGKRGGNLILDAQNLYKLAPPGLKHNLDRLRRVFPAQSTGNGRFTSDNEKPFQNQGQEEAKKDPENSPLERPIYVVPAYLGKHQNQEEQEKYYRRRLKIRHRKGKTAQI